jgi:hypothetical protein
MRREIITPQDTDSASFRTATGGHVAATRTTQVEPPTDDYSSRLIKYIPAEVVAVYLTVQSAILAAVPSAESGTQTTTVDQPALFWGVFVILLVLTPLYLLRTQGVTKKVQLIISTLSFAVWVFTIGGPFLTLSWYQPLYGAVLLPLYTFGVALIEPRR